jgi:tetratricopeptide (TPR) repeat protein
MKKFTSTVILLVSATLAFGADKFAPAGTTLAAELQWLAVQTACVGQYNIAQTGDYTLGDPQDYYKPGDIREYLTELSDNRTATATFYGICFDYAQSAYDDILSYQSHYEKLGMQKNGWYIAAVQDNSRQIILYDPVSREKATVIRNGVYLKENSRKNVQAHEGATNHAWLWVYGNDGTIYWIDPTWTDNAGYVWWGVVQDSKEVSGNPPERLSVVKTSNNAQVFAYFNSGNANKNKGLYDQAIADYTQAIRLDPNYAAVYNNRGNAYDDKGDNDRAIADYTQAIRLDPNYASAYYGRGNAYYMKKDYDRAIADYTQAIRLDPNDAKAYYNRGATYYDQKDYDRAIADFEAALKINPNYENAKKSLEIVRQQRGR